MHSDYELILPENIQNNSLNSSNLSENYLIIYSPSYLLKKKAVLLATFLFLIYIFEKTYGYFIKLNPNYGFSIILITFIFYLIFHFYY